MNVPRDFTYTCSQCGEVHEGAPSFSYASPAPYDEASGAQSDHHLSSDLCYFTDEDGTHFFVRACLEVPIHDFDEPFLWGIWASLSEASFDRYVETYDDPDPNDCYFGWLCNHLPFYPETYAMKLDVHPRDNGVRPFVVPEPTGHPLSIDYHEGIPFARAMEIARCARHGADG